MQSKTAAEFFEYFDLMDTFNVYPCNRRIVPEYKTFLDRADFFFLKSVSIIIYYRDFYSDFLSPIWIRLPGGSPAFFDLFFVSPFMDDRLSVREIISEIIKYIS